MSLSRQIKTLFTLSSLIFTYIIWAMASITILYNEANYKVYIISLCSVFLMQYLVEKRKTSIFQFLIPFFISIVVNIIIFDMYSAIYNSLYIFSVLIFFNKLESEEVNYDVYKTRVKTIIYTLIISGAILLVANGKLAQSILKFYIVYLVSAVILLRETRKFESKISDKKSIFVNLGIVFSMMFLSIDKINNILSEVFSFVLLWVNIGLGKIAMRIVYVLYVIIKPILIYLESKGKLHSKIIGSDTNLKMSFPSFAKGLQQKDSITQMIIFVIFKIIIVIIILYIMYRAFQVYGTRDSVEEGETQKEKIVTENKRIKHSYLSRFAKLFKGEGDFKTQVLNVYLKFEQKMSDKEIYKAHMTAGQLSTVAKTQIHDPEAINSITSIYNEAKFSNHIVLEENVKVAKLNYESVKEVLKKKL